MAKLEELHSPTQNQLLDETPMEEEKLRMKKELGLLEGIAIILGVIFGSGM